MCGRAVDWRNIEPPCDQVCGGAGCDSCGDGISCDGSGYGAMAKANKAMDYALDVQEKLLGKDASGRSVRDDVREAQAEANQARDDAQMAFDESERARNISETNKVELQNIIDKIFDFLDLEKASPESVRSVSPDRNNILSYLMYSSDRIIQINEMTEEGLLVVDCVRSAKHEHLTDAR